MAEEFLFTASAVLLLLGAVVVRVINPVSFGFVGWLVPLLVVGMYATLLIRNRRASKSQPVATEE